MKELLITLRNRIQQLDYPILAASFGLLVLAVVLGLLLFTACEPQPASPGKALQHNPANQLVSLSAAPYGPSVPAKGQFANIPFSPPSADATSWGPFGYVLSVFVLLVSAVVIFILRQASKERAEYMENNRQMSKEHNEATIAFLRTQMQQTDAMEDQNKTLKEHNEELKTILEQNSQLLARPAPNCPVAMPGSGSGECREAPPLTGIA